MAGKRLLGAAGVTVLFALALVGLSTGLRWQSLSDQVAAQVSTAHAQAPSTPTPTPPGQDPGPISVPGVATLPVAAGTALIIECKWELPDMTPGEPTVTYGGVGSRDDNPWVTADGSACDPGLPGAADRRHHMMGIAPNPDDQPIRRRYENWVAIQSTSIDAIGDVVWKVWEPYRGPLGVNNPDGPNCGPGAPAPLNQTPIETFDAVQYCLQYQHHATATLGPPTPANPLTAVPCATLQAATEMFQAALETGQMTQSEANEIIDSCFRGRKAIYKVQEEISKDQPCGEYRVEVTALNSVGAPFSNVNLFDVLCFVHLQLDFTTVDWGTIHNSETSNVFGDFLFQDPPVSTSTNPPTVRNVGNAPMFVETHFDPLVLAGDPTAQVLQFDVKLRAEWQTNPATITVVDPIFAPNDWYCFDQHPLGSNQNGRLDLSVHPQAAIAGVYTGAVDVVGRRDCAPPHAGVHQSGHP